MNTPASTASAITDEINLIRTVLLGYPSSIASRDALRGLEVVRRSMTDAEPTAQPVGQAAGEAEWIAHMHVEIKRFHTHDFSGRDELHADCISDALRKGIARGRAAVEPSQPAPDPWHDAVLTQCMLVESCYQPAHPVATLATLIAWHVMNERASTSPAPAAPRPDAQDAARMDFVLRGIWRNDGMLIDILHDVEGFPLGKSDALAAIDAALAASTKGDAS